MKIKCDIVKIEQKQTLDGKKFNVYKTTDSKGKLLDVKFTAAANFTPTGRGTVIGEGNVDKQRRYPCVWIKSVEQFEPWAEPEADNDEPVDVSELI